jgi:hypothetical protein
MLRADLQGFGAPVGFEDSESRLFQKSLAQFKNRQFVIDD